MKTGVWVVFYLLATGLAGYGQFEEPLSIRNASIETSGGITYFKLTYDYTCPRELWKQPPGVEGTNIMQGLVLISNPARTCPLIFPPLIETAHESLVLGRLEPGNYLLTVYTTEFWFPNPRLLFREAFSVPAVAPTMSLLPSSADKIAVHVAGTSNVLYSVEASSTLTNWATVHTSNGAPFTFTNDITAMTFFRVRVDDGVGIVP
jgi:hypothetical protein